MHRFGSMRIASLTAGLLSLVGLVAAGRRQRLGSRLRQPHPLLERLARSLHLVGANGRGAPEPGEARRRERVRARLRVRMPRAALFALVGVGFLAHWSVTDPAYDVSPTQSQWGYVLWFSGGIAALALALPLFTGLVGGRTAFRLSFVPAGGAVVSSVANVLEDGLDWGWTFFGFVLGSGIVGLGLVAVTAALALTGRGAARFFSLVPATTLAGIQLYVSVGGVLMLVAWLAAAAVALERPRGALPTSRSEPT